ncbi:glutamyl-tRNA reductase [Apibacter muscae]|nr:glutamyl-tRNA reductase [Apibacter muscae]
MLTVYLSNCINNFFVVSLSYEKANSKVRGKFSFDSNTTQQFCEKISLIDPYTRVFVLSTCNRTEIYVQTEKIQELIKIFCKHIYASSDEFLSYSCLYQGEKAIKHFFRVASGLESQIIGDFEIISQIKKSFNSFKKFKLTNAFLERLVNTGIQISKKIKNSTALSSGATSVSYAAVYYLIHNVPEISSKKIILVGTGKIGRNTCENLIKHLKYPNNLTLINRTRANAQDLADSFHLNVKDYKDLHTEINQSDIVIVATGANKTIFNKEDLTNNSKSITFLDLSVPNNVCPSLKESKNVKLLNVDDLSGIINQTFKQRIQEIPKAEGIIQEIMQEFILWCNNRRYVPLIQAFKSDLEKIKNIQKKSLDKDLSITSKVEDELSNQLIQKITNRLADYLINNPDKSEIATDLFKEMFKLQIAQ